MSLTDRILPPDEWARLGETDADLGQILQWFRPERTRISVVENESGQIVGCWAAVQWWHAEGVWIHPAYRQRVSVARRLWRQMRAIVMGDGEGAVITGAADPMMTALLTRQRATPLPQEYVLCLR